MPADCLIDTGATLALLDRNDRWHTVCTEAFRHLRLDFAILNWPTLII
jgi:predicted nucleic acid-binding protein